MIRNHWQEENVKEDVVHIKISTERLKRLAKNHLPGWL